MKQVLRKGLKDIVVDEVPDPLLAPGHVLVRPLYSLISSGTETASIHQEGVLKEVAGNPSHLRTVWDAMMATSPLRTLAEVRAKFGEYAVLGYSGAGVVAGKDSRVEDLETGGRVAYGGEGTGHGETILVGRNLVAKVPAEVPLENACFATLGSIAMNAVRTANIGSHGFSVLELRANGLTVFRENSRCSQGTGNFLRQLVERFSLTVEEASALCADVPDPAPLCGRCPVILKTDMTHLANKGEDRARILAGLFDAVCENVSVLIKPGVSPARVLLTGGVSRSPRVRRIFAEWLAKQGMNLVAADEEQLLCLEALGCALIAAENRSEEH